MTPEELNNVAAMAVLGYDPTVMCPQDVGTTTGGMICARCGGAAPDWAEYDSGPRPEHPFLPPNMALPENVVKMIEWLKPKPSTTDGRREAWDRLWMNEAFLMPLATAVMQEVVEVADVIVRRLLGGAR